MCPPTISKLAMQYLSVQASSRPVKWFSITGNIFRPEGRRLTDTVIGHTCSYILDLH